MTGQVIETACLSPVGWDDLQRGCGLEGSADVKLEIGFDDRDNIVQKLLLNHWQKRGYLSDRIRLAGQGQGHLQADRLVH